MSGLRWADTTDDEEDFPEEDQPETPLEESITPQQVRAASKFVAVVGTKSSTVAVLTNPTLFARECYHY